ncbi:MAG: hypothetical protein ACOX3T_04315 [Bdellovibrionota bacterium]
MSWKEIKETLYNVASLKMQIPETLITEVVLDDVIFIDEPTGISLSDFWEELKMLGS